MRSIDPRRTLIGWAAIGDDDPYEKAKGVGGGRFVDLRTLAFALTDKSLSLESACELLGHPYAKQAVEYGTLTETLLGYGRQDVAATATLYRDCLAELAKHPGVSLEPHRLYSPATVGAQYLQAMGLAKPLAQHPIPDELLGDCMSAFYGGRAEARIVRVPLPVVVVDFTSMYPAQNALLGTWDLLTAERVEIEDVTDHVRGLVSDPALFERLHGKETWADDVGVTFVQLSDIDGAVLPVRARYEPPKTTDTTDAANGIGAAGLNGNLGIGVNPLHYDGTLTYALPDVLAAALLGSPAFTIVKATRLRGLGRQRGLKSVKLRGRRELDPTKRDPFLAMIEERHSVKRDDTVNAIEKNRLDLFLKITANATSYGSLARFDRREKPKPVPVTAYGPADVQLTAKTSSPEEPGPYCFPPVAASITAGARLMLALIETHLEKVGGSYAFMDTDSAAIVATSTGGQVPCPGEADGTLTALSHAQVRDILRAFDDLNPYGPQIVNGDPAIPRSPWKVEHDSIDHPVQALVISAKRYLLYRGDPTRLALVHASDDQADPAADGTKVEEQGDSEQLELTDWSEHGIGAYQDPLGTRDAKKRRNWTRDAWTYLLQVCLGHNAEMPAWAAKPALTQFTISNPRQRSWFRKPTSGVPEPDAPRPAGFGLLGQVAPAGSLTDRTIMPAAGYTGDSDTWRTIAWYNRVSGEPLNLVTANRDDSPELYAEQLLNGAVELRTWHRSSTATETDPNTSHSTPEAVPRQPTQLGNFSDAP